MADDLPGLPTLPTRPLPACWPTVATHLVAPLPPRTCRRVAVDREAPSVRGRCFFPGAASSDELENASPFAVAMDGDLDVSAALVPTSPEGVLPDGSDPLRAFYLLLLPPLRDVLRRGFDLPAPLYAYQSDGVAFLARRRHALLADDMGLGKTVQTIVALRVLLGSGLVRRALILCPAGLKSNWKSEFRRWAPEVAVQVVHGESRQREAQWQAPAHVLVANYEVVRTDAAATPAAPYDLVVLDEAQRIKNRETQTSRAIKALPRRASWSLTGTPIENEVGDLASIYEFVHPDEAGAAPDMDVETLRGRIRPYFLRRRKDEVLEDLPAKHEYTTWLELTEAQQESYRVAEEEGTVYLRGLGETISLQHVLALITRLKQICNFDPATGESAKLDYLRDSVEVIAERGEKALIFSQYTQTLHLLAERLRPFRPILYHGGLSTHERDGVIQRFKADDALPLLLISLQAGGVGLNLQEASYVYHFDRWWNPAVERQAEGRAHRMGQTRVVMVARLVLRDTIEERIHEVLAEKERLFERIVEETPDDRTRRNLTDGEYFRLVGLDPALARVRRGDAS